MKDGSWFLHFHLCYTITSTHAAITAAAIVVGTENCLDSSPYVRAKANHIANTRERKPSTYGRWQPTQYVSDLREMKIELDRAEDAVYVFAPVVGKRKIKQ